MAQISIMLSIADTARADMLVSADRIYYRFATIDTLEDGDLKGLKDRYTLVETRLKDALNKGAKALADNPDETLPADLRATIFFDNLRYGGPITRSAIKSIADELARIDDVFSFVEAFVR